MPLDDLEPRLPTVYRLRLGQKDHGRPKHLDGQIRATSAVPEVVAQIAECYNGSEPTRWESPDGPQSQTILPALPIKVVILPGQALSQWWEKWNAGGCVKRCNGVANIVDGLPCSCPEVEERLRDRTRWCQPTTRLSVLLPKLKLLYAGRLDSTGEIAARGIGATIELAQAALDQGVMVGATLTVRQRGTGAKQYVWPELTLHGEVPAGVLMGRRPEVIGREQPSIEAAQEA